jgi:hypothetical protein
VDAEEILVTGFEVDNFETCRFGVKSGSEARSFLTFRGVGGSVFRRLVERT